MKETEMFRRNLVKIRERIEQTAPIEDTTNYPKDAIDVDMALSEVYKMIEELEVDLNFLLNKL